MEATNGMTGQTNAENLAKVREAMAKAQLQTTSDMVQGGGKSTFTELIDYIGLDGKEYKGYVVFKRVTAKDLMKIGGLKSEYFRQAGITDLTLVDDAIRLLAHVLSYLKVTVLKSPEWFFDVDSIEDVGLLYEVYGSYMKATETFRKDVPTAEAGNSEASENTTSMDA